MAYFIADLAYLLAILCDLLAILLALEWLVHLLPGPGLNFARRVLFRASLPWLKWCDRFFSLKVGSFNSRGLFMALLFLAIGRYGLPWLILFSYSLRG
jgi:hypothetical protein